MATSDGDYVQKIGADPTGFLAGWQRAIAGAKSGGDAIKDSFSGLTGAIKSVQSAFVAVTAVIAAGAFFKDAIDSAVKFNDESLTLAKSLGLTGEQATTLNTALKDIGSDSATYTSAFQKFAMQLRRNETGVQAMGLQTRDANGHLRDSNTLFAEALAVVGTYKPGLDQTTASMTLFGKNVNDVITLQKLNNEVLAEARQKNEDLGLTLSVEGVASTKAYKLAMNGLGDVFLGIKNAIGQALMPMLTDLGSYLARSGPIFVTIFKVALEGLLLVFRGLQAAVKVVSGVIFELINMTIENLGNLGSIITKVLHGDFAGAWQSAKDIGSRIGQGFKTAFVSNVKDAIVEAQVDFHADMQKMWAPTPLGKTAGGTKTMGDLGKAKPVPSKMGEWDAMLAEQKLAEQKLGLDAGQFREMSLADEAKFWRDKAAIVGISIADHDSATKKAAQAEMAGIKQTLTEKMAALQAEEAAFKFNTAEKLKLELQVQAMYKSGTKGYEDSQKKINEINRQAAEQAKSIRDIQLQSERDAALQTIAIEEQTVQTQLQLGLITQAQSLAADQAFENRRAAIAKQALLLRLADLNNPALNKDTNVVAIKQTNAQIEALEQQHQLKLKMLRDAAMVESKKHVTETLDAIGSSWASLIGQLAQGTITLGGFIQGVFKSVADAVINTLADLAAKWAIQQIKDMILGKVGAAAKITENAAVAGAAATASAAAIPLYGWMIAPAAGAEAFAAAMAYMGLLTAAQGFDIPGNINPIVQTHAREMILPAKHADVIRNLADSGGKSSASGGGTVLIKTTGGDWIHRNDLAQLLTKMHRNFEFVR